ARIASELSQAETFSREAEAALAELLARQAAMRAERRVAEAALEAARAQLGRTENEKQRLTQQIEALGDGSDEDRAREKAEADVSAAAQSRGAARAKRVKAERGRTAAADQRDAAETELASVRAAL